ncbi:MAG TPA: ATP-dependent DNA helicase RecQ [Gaiellaceae bacterium]|nr:ATP-dependent DNA helicase RecQ [Gaiellaceae bacterium]
MRRDSEPFDAVPILARLTALTTPLRELFGFGAFRPGQEEVTRAALEGRDTLALMPTGSGKSLTYQLAGMLRSDTTLVLSPLIALMKDQVDKLPVRVAPAATFVNSSLTSEETADRLAAASAGYKRLVYAAPERLRQRGFVDLLRSVGIGLVVVDEAHCVSMWGHDFRPDYLFIRHALAELGEPTLLGMTATATPETAREIGDALGREPEVVRTTVVRPNLRYEVEEVANADDRVSAVVGRLETLEGGSAIVYARSRRSTEELARTLRGYGFRAEHYHAGLEPEERTRVQDAFVSGRAQTVVATTAFGMGIDKPDVRLVCLVNYPSSLEEYTQMVGRAGRDGERSDTLLLAGPADAGSLRRFALSDVPPASDLRAAYRVLRDAAGPVDPEEVAATVPGRDPRVLVGMLEQARLVRRGFDRGRRMQIEVLPAPDDAAERVEALLERARLVASARAERIVEFAESRRCRHAQIAEHFGEAIVSPCGSCDVCSPRAKAAPPVSKAPPLPDDAGSAIAEAVAGLRWPLGRRSLVAALRGSPTAPPSARRSLAYGMLAAASEADVRRWVRLLESVGALVETTTAEGYRVLQVDPAVAPPRIKTTPAAADADEDLVERLRGWRQRRSHADGVPAFVVLHDTTVRELASAKPQTYADLAAVKGFGPVKIDRYGDEVLALISDGRS